MAEANRRFLLAERPTGPVDENTYDLVSEPVPEIGDGEALVRVKWISIDPTNRTWIGEVPTYLPPVAIGEVMRGLGLGEVVESKNGNFPVGALVNGLTGWQDYAVISDENPLMVVPDGVEAEPAQLLGMLGMTGCTAYFGMLEIGEPKEGETVVVSAAAGAVGTVAGQLAKMKGARVVGIAGGPDKCAWLTDELGFDAAVDYKADDWREQLAAATPDGIDVEPVWSRARALYASGVHPALQLCIRHRGEVVRRLFRVAQITGEFRPGPETRISRDGIAEGDPRVERADGDGLPATTGEAAHRHPGGVRMRQGEQEIDLAADAGDYVVKRADGLFAYQLAVVVDDAEAGVTHVVRGADLLDSTARQIHLLGLLGHPVPAYAQLPLATNPAGEKLSKQTLARAIDEHPPQAALLAALRFLGHNPPDMLTAAPLVETWAWARAHWSLAAVPRRRQAVADGFF